MHLIDAAARRDGHVGRRRHHHRQRRRLRLRAAATAGSDAIVVSFFGDGATEEGVFAESLNFAVLKQLPVLFVCENNDYAIHTHQSRRQGVPDICDKARGVRHAGRAARRQRRARAAASARARRWREVRGGRGAVVLRGDDLPLARARRPGRGLPPRLPRRGRGEPWVAADAGARGWRELLDADERGAIEAEVEDGDRRGVRLRRGQPVPRRRPNS